MEPLSPFKLLTGNREEVEFKLCIAEEHLHHASAEPEGGLYFDNQIYPYGPNTLSKGGARSDANVQFLINPPESTGVRYWRAGAQNFDPIYGTPTAPEFQAPFITEAVIKFEESGGETITATEFGQEFAYRARGFIAVNYHYTNNLPEPQEGDLIEFWADSWYTLGIFYNIIRVSRAGRIFNTPYWTVWELELERNENFAPERRLLSSGSASPYVVLPEEFLNSNGQSANGQMIVNSNFTPAQKEVTVTTPGIVNIPLDQKPMVADSQLVFVNGLTLKPGEEYVVINGEEVQINCPLNTNDEVMIFYLVEQESSTGVTMPGNGNNCGC